jgi:hypothetical protein
MAVYGHISICHITKIEQKIVIQGKVNDWIENSLSHLSNLFRKFVET